MSSEHVTEPSTASAPRAPWLLLLAATCLVAANMRTSITGLGPLLEQIAADLGSTPAALGALASVPLITWAIVSPLTHALGQRFGMNTTILAALLVLTAGTIWRSTPGPAANLWLGTVLIGAALAIANVLMPAVIKRDFPARVPIVMAVFTALLGGVGAISSGVVVPISRIPTADGTLGWRVALLATGIMLPIVIAVWVWASRASRRADVHALDVPVPPKGRTGVWSDPVAWLVAGYMGTQSASFYMLVTWLAPISTSLGRSETTAGIDVMLFQVFGVIGSLGVPVLLHGRLRRAVPGALPFVAFVAALGLMVAPGALLLWAGLAGLSAGASLGMALTLMAERAPTPATAGALSGMSQSVGYVIAAIGPIAFGWVHELTHGWNASLGLLAGVLAAQVVLGAIVGDERRVLTPR